MIKKIERRKFIRDTSYTTLALSLSRFFTSSAAFAAENTAERIIFFYHPDGTVTDKWHPQGGGREFSLGESMRPLEQFKDQLLLLRNLRMVYPENAHPAGAKRLLTGNNGGNASSLDTFLADKFASQTSFNHIHLGIQTNTSHSQDDKMITRLNGGSQKTPEDDPAKVFDQLFGALPSQGTGGEGKPDQRKILEISRKEIELLIGKLGNVEKDKLASHLAAINELSKRVGSTVSEGCAPHQRPSLYGDAARRDENIPAVTKMQIDNMVGAMSCGLSRVGTIQLSHHTSEMYMGWVEGNMRSHEASHNNRDTHARQKTWVNEQIAYLLEQLRNRQDPVRQGTMLDNTLVVVVTEVAAGSEHTMYDMPFYIAGGGGGAIKTGQVIDCGNQPNGNLMAALSHAMGVNIDGFGNEGSGVLREILA